MTLHEWATLAGIEKTRRKKQRKHIREEFQAQKWWWRKVFKWMFLSPPTKESATAAYKGTRLGVHFIDKCIGWKSEEVSQKLLRTAERCEGNSLWVTPEAANLCGLA